MKPVRQAHCMDLCYIKSGISLYYTKYLLSKVQYKVLSSNIMNSTEKRHVNYLMKITIRTIYYTK